MRNRLITYLAVLCASIVSGCALGRQNNPDTRDALVHFLEDYTELSSPEQLQYMAAFRDLNNDAVDEAVVYLTSSEFCGSGGCTTLVLTPEAESYRVISRITISKLPVRVLSATSNGWHNLSVMVQGGGIEVAYEAELRFDGTTYPTNPTVPPARELHEGHAGEVLIPVEENLNSEAER